MDSVHVHGNEYAAGHLAMPFGTTSAVYARHRYGGLIGLVVIVPVREPNGRLVDDNFGISKRWGEPYKSPLH